MAGDSKMAFVAEATGPRARPFVHPTVRPRTRRVGRTLSRPIGPPCGAPRPLLCVHRTVTKVGQNREATPSKTRPALARHLNYLQGRVPALPRTSSAFGIRETR